LEAQWQSRDHLLILAMFRHGLRVSEAIGLRRDEVDLDHARLWVKKATREQEGQQGTLL
jgi:integrase